MCACMHVCMCECVVCVCVKHAVAHPEFDNLHLYSVFCENHFGFVTQLTAVILSTHSSSLSGFIRIYLLSVPLPRTCCCVLARVLGRSSGPHTGQDDWG